jgi:hypothetical protein
MRLFLGRFRLVSAPDNVVYGWDQNISFDQNKSLFVR